MEEKPPIFKSWNHWYWFVMAVLAVEVGIFYLISRAFA
jgi:hypothetical protein